MGPRGPGRHLQMEVLLPHRVQVPVDGLRPFLGLPDLDGDIGVTRSRLVLCLQALGTDHWKTRRTYKGGLKEEGLLKTVISRDSRLLAGDTCDVASGLGLVTGAGGHTDLARKNEYPENPQSMTDKKEPPGPPLEWDILRCVLCTVGLNPHRPQNHLLVGAPCRATSLPALIFCLHPPPGLPGTTSWTPRHRLGVCLIGKSQRGWAWINP